MRIKKKFHSDMCPVCGGELIGVRTNLIHGKPGKSLVCITCKRVVYQLTLEKGGLECKVTWPKG